MKSSKYNYQVVPAPHGLFTLDIMLRGGTWADTTRQYGYSTHKEAKRGGRRHAILNDVKPKE